MCGTYLFELPPHFQAFPYLDGLPQCVFTVGSRLREKLSSSKHIQEEVKAAFDFSYTPPEDPDAPKRFGVKDVTDLSWKSLMDCLYVHRMRSL